MTRTVSKFVVLVDDGKVQYSLGYLRESEAWAEFWKQVSQQSDDGVALTGFDEGRVLVSRTGLDACNHRWYVHLMKETT